MPELRSWPALEVADPGLFMRPVVEVAESRGEGAPFRGRIEIAHGIVFFSDQVSGTAQGCDEAVE